jgi:hypothetical protein
MWDDELDDTVLIELQHAYIRRKRFEARLQAYQTVSLLVEAIGGSSSRPRVNKHSVVSLGQFMNRIGAKWQ